MNALVKKIHLLIFAWTAFTVWQMYEEYNDKKEQIILRIPDVKSKIAKARKEKIQLKKYFEDIKTAKSKIEIVAQQVEKLQQKLPNRISDAENLDMIKGIAENLNIKNVFLQPSTEENKGFYITKKYNFQGTGTFLQFLIFFEKLGLSDRLLNVKGIHLLNNLAKQRGRFQLINCEAVIEAYRYNPDHREDRGIQAIESEFKNKKPERKPRRKPRGKK